MANMDVEIISMSCITPSSPTQPHLKPYKISLLDQFEPSTYIGTILFYQATMTPQRSNLLKHSLSETLSRFYPVAGKIKDKFSIDCTDEGVYYTEAKSNISLFRYLSNPDLAALYKLMPNANPDADLPSGSPVCLIQETRFIDGGFSIGMYLSHMVGDGYSMFLFMKEWAAAAAKSAVKQPFLGGESIFPQYKTFPTGGEGPASLFASFLKEGNYVTKRFVFSGSAIANLKAEKSLQNIKHLTRFEIVAAVLSKWLMGSFTSKTGIKKPLLVSVSVDLRRKAQLPTSPAYAFGNFLGAAGVLFSKKEKKELGEFVMQLRESLKNMDKNFVNKIKNGGEDGYLKYYEALKEISDLNANASPIYLALSSLCHFNFGVLNFGWGKPIWKGCFTRHVEDSNMPSINAVILMETRDGKGVDAWVTLNQNEFDFVEKGTLIPEYVSVDSSPLLYTSAQNVSKL